MLKVFTASGVQSEEWWPLPQRTGCDIISDSCLWIFSKCCSPERQILLPVLCLDQDGSGGRVTSNNQRKTDLGLLKQDKHMQIEISEVINLIRIIYQSRDFLSHWKRTENKRLKYS